MYEVTVVPGLADFAYDELRRRFGSRAALGQPPQSDASALRFAFAGDPRVLLGLRTVVAVFVIRRFGVPRPRGLLGDEHLRVLVAHLAAVRGLHPRGAFQTLAVAGAGADSPVMRRLAATLAVQSGLQPVASVGDLQLHVRPSGEGEGSWDVLVRLSPRPLSTRSWRVCDLPGALNATVAYAMAWLTKPMPSDVVLNVGCGSGTLLIERAGCGVAHQLVGCDWNGRALDCARRNIDAGRERSISLIRADVRRLPLCDGVVNVLLADLPFGHLMGSHVENAALYPALLDEAARVALPGARFVLITAEIRHLRRLLRPSGAWECALERGIVLAGLPLRIFVLVRR